MKLSIKILIPGAVAWSGEAEQINIQTTSGKITILPNHISLLSVIETSVLAIKLNDSQLKLVVISDGYLSITENNEINIVADRCISEEKINLEKLEKNYKEAIERVNQAKTPTRKYMANKALKRFNCCYEILNYRKDN